MRSAMRMAGAIVAMGLLAAPAVAQGGGQGPVGTPVERGMMRGMMRGGPMGLERNPAAVVLEHRQALDLSAEQVARLEAIRARVEEQNRPRWERMREAFGTLADVDRRELTFEERQALRDRMRERVEELRSDRAAIRAINRSAGQEIHQLLTEEQESRLRPLMHDRRGRRGDGPPPPQRPRGPRGPRGGGL